MTFAPQIVDRPAELYAAFRQQVSMDAIVAFADRVPTVAQWLASHDAFPTGPAFFRYNVIDMERAMEMEGGFPIAAWIPADGDFYCAELPAGRYVTVTHIGAPSELMGVTGDLLAWAADQGLEFDHHDTPAGDEWECRLEIYRTDPRTEPDMSKWETELAFKLA